MPIPATTTFSIDGHRIVRYCGVVRGIVVRSPFVSVGFLGGLKAGIDRDLRPYAQMCEQARLQAYQLMIDQAVALGAGAVVGVHYESSDLSQTGDAVEIMCYGTAVVIEPSAATPG